MVQYKCNAMVTSLCTCLLYNAHKHTQAHTRALVDGDWCVQIHFTYNLFMYYCLFIYHVVPYVLSLSLILHLWFFTHLCNMLFRHTNVFFWYLLFWEKLMHLCLVSSTNPFELITSLYSILRAEKLRVLLTDLIESLLGKNT